MGQTACAVSSHECVNTLEAACRDADPRLICCEEDPVYPDGVPQREDLSSFFDLVRADEAILDSARRPPGPPGRVQALTLQRLQRFNARLPAEVMAVSALQQPGPPVPAAPAMPKASPRVPLQSALDALPAAVAAAVAVPAAHAAPAQSSMASAAALPSSARSAKEAPVVMQDSVMVSMTMHNLHYDSLVSDEALRREFEWSVKKAIAEEAGNGILPEHVQLTLSSGSVVVQSTIHPPPHVAVHAASLQSRLSASVSLGQNVVASVARLSKIAQITTGSIRIGKIESMVVSLPMPEFHMPSLQQLKGLQESMPGLPGIQAHLPGWPLDIAALHFPSGTRTPGMLNSPSGDHVGPALEATPVTPGRDIHRLRGSAPETKAPEGSQVAASSGFAERAPCGQESRLGALDLLTLQLLGLESVPEDGGLRASSRSSSPVRRALQAGTLQLGAAVVQDTPRILQLAPPKSLGAGLTIAKAGALRRAFFAFCSCVRDRADMPAIGPSPLRFVVSPPTRVPVQKILKAVTATRGVPPVRYGEHLEKYWQSLEEEPPSQLVVVERPPSPGGPRRDFAEGIERCWEAAGEAPPEYESEVKRTLPVSGLRTPAPGGLKLEDLHKLELLWRAIEEPMSARLLTEEDVPSPGGPSVQHEGLWQTSERRPPSVRLPRLNLEGLQSASSSDPEEMPVPNLNDSDFNSSSRTSSIDSDVSTPRRQAAAAVAAARAAEKRAARVQAPATLQGITFQGLLADLDGFEERVYGAVCPKAVPLDNAELRAFVLGHSCIPHEHLDPELYRVAPDLRMTQERLIQLLRENALGEEAAIVLFWNLSRDGEQATLEACRASMLECVEQGLGKRFGQRGQSAVDFALQDCDDTLYLDEWLTACQFVARGLRLADIAGL